MNPHPQPIWRAAAACALAVSCGATLAQSAASSAPPVPAAAERDAPASIVVPPGAARAPTSVLGAPPTGQVPGPGPYTAAQITEAFRLADANRDGQLSRAESQRLAILPMAFEDIDRDKDGVVTREEYEAAFR